MPYVTNDTRKELDIDLEILTTKLAKFGDDTLAGNLNYIFTSLILQTMPREPRYKHLNSAIGALECCKQELYRRLGSQIEDTAIRRNMDLRPYVEKCVP